MKRSEEKISRGGTVPAYQGSLTVNPGPYWARIAIPETPFSGPTGNGVHAHGKNDILPLFFKTDGKTGILNLHYSGLFSGSFMPEVLKCAAR